MSHLVIVGASSGIGLEIAPLLAGDHTVTRLNRDADVWKGPMRCDALLLCQRYRGPDEWNGELDVSLTKTKRIMEWAGRYMEGGSIVVMGSVAAVSVEDEQPVSYHACKAALMAMVRYYAVTLGPKQIRVNAIIPGLTIKSQARAFYDAHPELENRYRDITPLGRLGSVEDIANTVDFLITNRGAYYTGQEFTLDGGIGLRSQWNLARLVTPALKDIPVTQRAMVSK